jgi:Na+/glutamate symporter
VAGVFVVATARATRGHFNKIVTGGIFAAFCRAKMTAKQAKPAIRPQTTAFSRISRMLF